MKNIKFIFFFMIGALIWSCDDDESVIELTAPTPTNISANVRVAQDNSGMVTITPLGEGVSYFSVNLGDGSAVIDPVEPGENVDHVYPEGSYDAVITGHGLDGSSTSITQTINVSFTAPSNLDVVIMNDEVVSKQVNVIVNADDAVSYTVDFGEGTGADPLEGKYRRNSILYISRNLALTQLQ